MKNRFIFLKTYLSPFKRLRPKFYFGRITIGVPLFYPRKWVNYSKEEAEKLASEPIDKGYMKDWSYERRLERLLTSQHPIPKKVGFDFSPLYWKTKWSDTDFRFEHSPVWSLVFFGWQVAIIWTAPHTTYFWESWLVYEYATDKTKSVRERIEQARKINPNIWSTYKDGKKKRVDYWTKVLRKKYLL